MQRSVEWKNKYALNRFSMIMILKLHGLKQYNVCNRYFNEYIKNNTNTM